MDHPHCHPKPPEVPRPNLALFENITSLLSERIDFITSDERRSLPPHAILELGRLGCFGLTTPRSLGGLALPLNEALRVIELVGSFDLSLASGLIIHNFLALRAISSCQLNGDGPLIRELSSGHRLACFAITEASAGSDPRRIKMTATHREQKWILNGQKIWIGLAAWSSYIVTYAKAHSREGDFLGTKGYVVETSNPGVRVSSEQLTLGLRGIVQNTVTFKNAVIPQSRVLTEPGERSANNSFQLGRIALAHASAGAMARAIQITSHYIMERRINTGSMLINTSVANTITNCIARFTACKHMLDHISSLCPPSQTEGALYSAAKLVASESAWICIDQCLQLLGGRGYIETNHVARLLRDSRVIRIFEGPSETLAYHLGRLISKNPTMWNMCIPNSEPALEIILNKHPQSPTSQRVKNEERDHHNLVNLGKLFGAAIQLFANSKISATSHATAFAACEFNHRLREFENRPLLLLSQADLLTTRQYIRDSYGEMSTCHQWPEGTLDPAFSRTPQ